MCGQVNWIEDAQEEGLDDVPTLDDVDPEEISSGFHVVTLGEFEDEGWAE